MIPKYTDVPPIASTNCGHPEGDTVCLPTVDVVKLARWIANEMELNRALTGCSLVVQQ